MAEEATPRALDPLVPLEKYRAEIEVHPNTMRSWVTSGRLPATKVGQRWFVRRSDFDSFIEAGRVGS